MNATAKDFGFWSSKAAIAFRHAATLCGNIVGTNVELCAEEHNEWNCCLEDYGLSRGRSPRSLRRQCSPLLLEPTHGLHRPQPLPSHSLLFHNANLYYTTMRSSLCDWCFAASRVCRAEERSILRQTESICKESCFDGCHWATRRIPAIVTLWHLLIRWQSVIHWVNLAMWFSLEPLKLKSTETLLMDLQVKTVYINECNSDDWTRRKHHLAWTTRSGRIAERN